MADNVLEIFSEVSRGYQLFNSIRFIPSHVLFFLLFLWILIVNVIFLCLHYYQIINAGITSGAKGALDLWRRQSTSSEGSMDEPEAEGKRDAVTHRVSFHDDLVMVSSSWSLGDLLSPLC